MAALAVMAVGAHADAQPRDRQVRLSRQEIARVQGVPPGQLPPANSCRVWYESRPPGRQPAATSCDTAERIASRDRNARVIYGENVFGQSGYSRNSRYPGDWNGPGPRAPRATEPAYGRYTTPAFQNGYRDGLEKGREDAGDNDRYDVNRHSWYRSATRGYENEYGSRSDYTARYRDGFQAGYDEGYRAFARRR
jgi:hypothetical protein